MSIAATPAKLKTGNWGARVKGPAKPGDVLTVTSQSGKSWEVEVDRVVWTNGDISVCATASRGLCKACGRRVTDAPHHRAMAGYCGECAFGEFDM